MLESYRLSDVSRAIRRYLDALDDNEPVDRIFLASVLANFDPHRELPHWLVIIGAPGTGKSKLIEMIAGWKPVFYMPAGISQGFFLSTRKEVENPALKRIKNDKKRILLWPDISSLTSVNRNYADAIHNQLIQVHDGRLYRESGMTGKAVDVTFAPNERVGFIAAGTPAWYGFNSRYNAIGTRFGVYYWPGKHWSVGSNIQNEEATTRGARYADAAAAVRAYLDNAIDNIDDLEKVKITKIDNSRIHALKTLLVRTQADDYGSADSGNRLFLRSEHLSRVLAFMDGRKAVADADLQLVFRYILSHATPLQQAALRELLATGATGSESLAKQTGATERVVAKVLRNLTDLDITVGKTTRCRFTDEAQRLADIVKVKG